MRRLITLCLLFSLWGGVCSPATAMKQYVIDCPGRDVMTVTVTDYVITTLNWANGFIVAPRAVNIVDKNQQAFSAYLFVNQDVLTVNPGQNVYRFAYQGGQVVTCQKVKDIPVRAWH